MPNCSGFPIFATLNSGKVGVIEEGALADLLVVKGNPLDDLKLLENPQKNLGVIMKDGRLHKNEM